MNRLDRLIIKANRLQGECGEDVVVLCYNSGQWVTGKSHYVSLEAAEQDIMAKSKGDVLFIVNDVGTPGPHPVWARIAKQKARYRHKEKRRLRKKEKSRLEAEFLKWLERETKQKEQERLQHEKELQEKQAQRAAAVGKVI